MYEKTTIFQNKVEPVNAFYTDYVKVKPDIHWNMFQRVERPESTCHQAGFASQPTTLQESTHEKEKQKAIEEVISSGFHNPAWGLG